MREPRPVEPVAYQNLDPAGEGAHVPGDEIRRFEQLGLGREPRATAAQPRRVGGDGAR